MKKRSLLCLAVLLLLTAVPALAADGAVIELSGQTARIDGAGARLDGDAVYIEQSGTYELSGAWESGRIVVTVPEDEDVTLKLAGLSVACPDGPALAVQSADEVVIELVSGTENALISGQPCDVLTAAADEEATGGALFVKEDLEITGEGALRVGGYIKNAIHCSKDLVVSGGQITAEGVKHAVKAKNSVTVTGGSLKLQSGADAVQTSEAEKDGKGYILITCGRLDIVSGGDALQAQTDLTVRGGAITARTGGGADAVSAAKLSSFDRWGYADWYGDGGDDGVSRKGLKAGGTLTVSGGVITLDTEDDCLHADRIILEDGEMTLASGDDGVHADHTLTVNGGKVAVTQSYEGLEGNQILIAGGELSVTARDDGLNACGGANYFGRGWGRASSAQDTDLDTPSLTITGGSLYVNAGGDGLDSNGDLAIAGGDITVDGPSDSGNAALDGGTENGGALTISGGQVMAAGSAGMAETFSDASSQPSFLYVFPGAAGAGDTVTISDGAGQVLASHELVRAADCVIFSSPALQLGETYTVSCAGQTGEITLSAVSVSNAGGGRFGWGRPFGGFDDRRGGWDNQPEDAPDGQDPQGGRPGDRRRRR